MADGGYIYIIYLREFKNAGQNVFKIGRSIDIHTRFKQYPKGSQLIYTCLVEHDIIRTERAVMNSLKHHCIQRKDIGTEYFEADRDHIIKLVGLVVDKPIQPPIKIENIEHVVSHPHREKVNGRPSSYKKQPPYTCACCGYETRRVSVIKDHLNRKSRCAQLPNGIILTDDIRQHIIQYRIYTAPVETSKNINVQQNNMMFINNMDSIDKIMKYTNHQNKKLISFSDHAANLFSEKDVTLIQPDIMDTFELASSLRKRNFTTLNVMYDDNDKIKIYNNEEWHTYLPIKGIQELMNVFQAVYLKRYECYLIHKIRSGENVKAREDLEQYYKLISSIDKKPYIFERCDSEILYETDDDRFEGPDRYSIEEEFMPLYTNAKSQVLAKETKSIIKEITTILKRNTKNNIRQLNMKVKELCLKDDAFKSIIEEEE
jgi:hypothetical protein